MDAKGLAGLVHVDAVASGAKRGWPGLCAKSTLPDGARPSGEVVKTGTGKRYRLPVRVYQAQPWCRLDLPDAGDQCGAGLRGGLHRLACWLGAAVKTSS